MGSLIYEVSHMAFDSRKFRHGEQCDDEVIMTQSKAAYKTQAIKFAQWCRDEYHCRHKEECVEHIQDYVDWLERRGLSADTIHTYTAGVCRWFGVPLANIKKPLRVSAKNTRSRGKKAVDECFAATRDASPRLFDCAEMVGVRRHEYAALRHNDLVTDESGSLCVQVRKGKGGKYTMQRILPEDELFVRSLFNGTRDYLFSKDEMEKNKIDLHHLRAQLAWRAYCYYNERLQNEPEYRAQLTKELKARWDALQHKKKWNPKYVEGPYWLRGENKKLAKKLGRPVKYDKLAVNAVSVFHLSHWRNNVTVSNYLLSM